MTTPYKLVAFDVDGTIADPKTGIIPADVRLAIHRLSLSGVPVVLTTGRAWVSTQEAAAQLADVPGSDRDKVSQYYVCSNGAVVCSHPPLEILHFATCDLPEGIYQLAQIPGIQLGAEDFGVGYKVTTLFDSGILEGVQTVVPLDEMAGSPCLKLIARKSGRGIEDAQFRQAVESVDLRPCAVLRGPGNWYDLVAPGTSKAHGLSIVLERLGITPAEVLAFGDGYNDVEILQWAGRGVAIGDAPQDVQRCADVVAPRFHDGGVLPELAHWFGV